MKKLWLKIRLIVSSRHVIGLYILNFIFQYIFFINTRRVFLIHFTNVISADKGFSFSGSGVLAERCLRINGGIVIQASNKVILDRSALLGPGVKLISGNHNLDDFTAPSVPDEPIEIGANCWVGGNAVILPGVKLLPGTIVGAGSVVTRSPGKGNVVVVGNPARIIKERSSTP